MSITLGGAFGEIANEALRRRDADVLRSLFAIAHIDQKVLLEYMDDPQERLVSQNISAEDKAFLISLYDSTSHAPFVPQALDEAKIA